MSSKATNSTEDFLTSLKHELQIITYDLILDTPLAELRPQLREMFYNAFAVVFEIINDLDNQDDIKQNFESLKQCNDTFNSWNLATPKDSVLPIFIAKNINGMKKAFQELFNKLSKLPEVKDEVKIGVNNVKMELWSLNERIFYKSILEMDLTQFMEENGYDNRK